MNFTAKLKQAVTDAINPAFFDTVAQIAHFSMTYAISYTLATKWGWMGYGSGALGCLLYSLAHEFWWDPRHENAATRGSDVRDFVFLCLGPAVAAIVYAA
jgi:hypothetical protein